MRVHNEPKTVQRHLSKWFRWNRFDPDGQCSAHAVRFGSMVQCGQAFRLIALG